MWPDRWKLEDIGEELAKAKEEAKEKVGHGQDMSRHGAFMESLSKMKSEQLDW